MKVKISKQLERNDKGVILSDSIAESNPVMKEDSKTILFPISLYVNEEAMNEKVPVIGGCVSFHQMRVSKVCSDSEWSDMNDNAGSGALVTGWFKEAIDNSIGLGFTELI